MGGYQSELEEIWAARGGNKPGPDVTETLKSVRGSDLFFALYELDQLLGDNDASFKNAAKALLEHEILDRHLHHNAAWRPPIERSTDESLVGMVSAAIDMGLSREAAYSNAAAHGGVKAASFQAAIKQVKRMFEKSGQMPLPRKSSDKS